MEGVKNDKADRTNFLGSIYGRGPGFAGAVFDMNYLCPTLTTMQGGGREPHIIVGVKNEIEGNNTTG